MSVTLESLFADQLTLCGIGAGQLIGIVAEHGHKSAYVEASVAAARQIGASALVLTASSLSQPLLPPATEGIGRDIPALLAAAGECDMVLDVTVNGLIHSDVRTRITGAGKRMLFVAEPPDVLRRLRGTADVRTRVERGAETLRSGRTLHVTSPAGTDLTGDVSAADLPVTCQWGYVDEAGRWDHWPSGFVACFPRDGSAEGVIVLQPGDVMLPWQRYLQHKVRLDIEGGYIRRIIGDNVDAANLRDYFETWADPEVYATSHMGWGVHSAASWAALELYDPRSLYGQELRSVAGNFMWSTGPNRFVGRHTPAHGGWHCGGARWRSGCMTPEGDAGQGGGPCDPHVRHFYAPESGHGLPHDPLNATIGPRPIGWMSSCGSSGAANLAPYSFFNMFNCRPPIVGFCSNSAKDTLRNVRETGAFVCNLVTRALAEQMNKTSAPAPYAVDEFALAGLTPVPSRFVAAPRVAESPVNLECRMTEIVQLRNHRQEPAQAWLVMGEVVGVHIALDLLQNGIFDTFGAGIVLRAGGPAAYAMIEPELRFDMVRPAM